MDFLHLDAFPSLVMLLISPKTVLVDFCGMHGKYSLVIGCYVGIFPMSIDGVMFFHIVLEF